MKVIVSAPGKIHLMGEHAVVYGAPALLAAINRRLTVTVTPNDKGLLIQSDVEDRLIREAVRVVQERFKLNGDVRATIRVSSAIPAGRHLGSSAAVSVATVGALLYFFKKIWNPELINKLAYEVEKKQHGTPSGGDNSICTYGGFVWFRKELDFLKTIWQLPFRIHSSLASFHLIDTGQPHENTGEMIAMVGKFLEKYKDHGRMLLDQNEQATKDVTVALKEGNERLLIDAIKRGEKTLEGLGVVSDKVLPLIQDIEKSGGAAKILGGGGKKEAVGFILAYHRDQKKLKEIASKHDKSMYNITLGEEGVRLESGRKNGNKRTST